MVRLSLARPLVLWVWWGCGLVGMVLQLVCFGRWLGWFCIVYCLWGIGRGW